MGYSPRVRAPSHIPSFKTWPEIEGTPKIQGFAGYKVGMTHAIIKDFREKSTTAEQEIQVPVTVVEVPPMKIAAVRFYERTAYGLSTIGEVWAAKVDKELRDRLPLPKKFDTTAAWKKVEIDRIEEVRVLAYTQPKLVKGIPKKVPDMMEYRIGGGTVQERLDYAKTVLGKEMNMKDIHAEGSMVDIAAITTGKGFQGHVKRWGVKLLSHKNSKHRRMIGTQGPWHPTYVLNTVPQAGQMGYHQRTEYNKRILKIGENGEEITPNGGFINYGVVKNTYVVIHGSIPGPSKRLIRFRDPIRSRHPEVAPEITYISTESKQGA